MMKISVPIRTSSATLKTFISTWNILNRQGRISIGKDRQRVQKAALLVVLFQRTLARNTTTTGTAMNAQHS